MVRYFVRPVMERSSDRRAMVLQGEQVAYPWTQANLTKFPEGKFVREKHQPTSGSAISQ